MTSYPPMEALLPHRAPMILLDAVEADARDSIACRVAVHAASPFVENGHVPAVIAIEYMAQCVAAYAGLRAVRNERPVRVAYLIGASPIEFSVDGLRVGENLRVEARRIWGDNSLGKFECSVDSQGRRVASGLLTVFQGDIEGPPGAGERDG